MKIKANWIITIALGVLFAAYAIVAEIRIQRLEQRLENKMIEERFKMAMEVLYFAYRQQVGDGRFISPGHIGEHEAANIVRNLMPRFNEEVTEYLKQTKR